MAALHSLMSALVILAGGGAAYALWLVFVARGVSGQN
jgi:hypothetical protein